MLQNVTFGVGFLERPKKQQIDKTFGIWN